MRVVHLLPILITGSHAFFTNPVASSSSRPSFVPSPPQFRHPTTSTTTTTRRSTSSTTAIHASSSNTDNNNGFDYALIFDCDGVILETEELHRLAYNAAFEAAGLQIDGEPVIWSVDYYDILQNTVGGGKNKMFFHFRNTTGVFPTSENASSPPSTAQEQQTLIDELQAHKTELYKTYIAEKATPRPGVLDLMDEAIQDPKCAVGVCSASTKEAVTKVLDVTLGEARRNALNVCLLGDDVSKLKPDPLIYTTAADRLQLDPSRCVVVEDSMVGLKAAKGANMRCIITYTSSTENEDFYGSGCDAKVPELAARKVTLDSIFGPLKQTGWDAEMLVGMKD